MSCESKLRIIRTLNHNVRLKSCQVGLAFENGSGTGPILSNGDYYLWIGSFVYKYNGTTQLANYDAAQPVSYNMTGDLQYSGEEVVEVAHASKETSVVQIDFLSAQLAFLNNVSYDPGSAVSVTPFGMVYLPDGGVAIVYSYSTGSGSTVKITVFNPNGTERWTSSVNSPGNTNLFYGTQLSTDSDSNVFVVFDDNRNVGTNQQSFIRIFNGTTGTVIDTLSLGPGEDEARAQPISAEGRSIFYATFDNGPATRVTKLYKGNDQCVLENAYEYPADSTKNISRTALAVDRNSVLWVGYGLKVQYFDTNFDPVDWKDISSDWAQAEIIGSLDVDSDGNIYVLAVDNSAGSSRLFKYDSAGTLLHTLIFEDLGYQVICHPNGAGGLGHLPLVVNETLNLNASGSCDAVTYTWNSFVQFDAGNGYDLYVGDTVVAQLRFDADGVLVNQADDNFTASYIELESVFSYTATNPAGVDCNTTIEVRIDAIEDSEVVGIDIKEITTGDNTTPPLFIGSTYHDKWIEETVLFEIRPEAWSFADLAAAQYMIIDFNMKNGPLVYSFGGASDGVLSINARYSQVDFSTQENKEVYRKSGIVIPDLAPFDLGVSGIVIPTTYLQASGQTRALEQLSISFNFGGATAGNPNTTEFSAYARLVTDLPEE